MARRRTSSPTRWLRPLKAHELKYKLLESAFGRFKPDAVYDMFCCEDAFWLDDFVAQVAICPVQDVLGLGGQARMNVPGTPRGNWRWRLRAEQLDSDAWGRLREMTHTYARD